MCEKTFYFIPFTLYFLRNDDLLQLLIDIFPVIVALYELVTVFGNLLIVFFVFKSPPRNWTTLWPI